MLNIAKALFLATLMLGSFVLASIPSDPLAVAAEYYFSKHDYPQALKLWAAVYLRRPQDPEVALRLSELKFMFDGRSAARDVIVKFLETNRDALSVSVRDQLRNRLSELQSTFLTDEGQSEYLQAQQKMRWKDWGGALSLLSSATLLEKGNLKILHDKSICEKSLGSYDRYFETLKLAFDADPFDRETLERLPEAYDFSKQYGKTVALFEEAPEALRTIRQKVALGVALAELGSNAKALPLLQKLIEENKQAAVSPAVLYALGKIFASRPDGVTEALSFLDRFLVSITRPENCLVEGWDPYHCAERTESARSMVAALRAR